MNSVLCVATLFPTKTRQHTQDYRILLATFFNTRTEVPVSVISDQCGGRRKFEKNMCGKNGILHITFTRKSTTFSTPVDFRGFLAPSISSNFLHSSFLVNSSILSRI